MRAFVRPAALLISTGISDGRAFLVAVVVIIGLVGIGAWFGYSDHWLSILSAALSIVTFLLVFLLQYRETRDTAAIQLKLNELLRAVEGAREREFADLEHLPDDVQESLSREHRQTRLDPAAAAGAAELAAGRSLTDCCG